MHRTRRGMTLFEVVISLGLVASAFVVVISAIPVGQRLQERARFQLYASAKAVDLLSSFNTLPPQDQAVSAQSTTGPWEAHSCYRPTVFDLEQRLGNQVNGMFPVPLDIARRLDSDDDEIQRLLANGGKLYYPSPKPTTALNQYQTAAAPPSEARRMVVGIIGDAQDNQIPNFPNRAWPIYAAYPSMPENGMGRGSLWEWNDPEMEVVHGANESGAISTRFNEVATVVPQRWDYHDSPPWDYGDATCAGAYWYAPAGAQHNVEVVRERALRYFALAVWYADRKGLTGPWRSGSRATTADIDALLAQAAATRGLQTAAVRILAHAGMILTRWFDEPTLSGSGTVLPNYTFLTPAGGLGTPLPNNLVITLDMIRNWHENCLDLAMAYASRLPYDWGVPRPYNRAIFSDAPLMQWDLWPSGAATTITGTINRTTQSARQWRILTPQPVLNGTSPEVPTLTMLETDGAAAARFNLTDTFHPSQRCRELVFWAVDWQSYEDFESAPSAPVDASRYFLNDGNNWTDRMNIGQASDGASAERPSFRNPERKLLFLVPPPTLAPGESQYMGDQIFNEEKIYSNNIPDMGSGQVQAKVFSGLHGADRNGNKHFDRGLRPATQRLRATTVARFIVYDPRLPMLLR